MHTNIGVRPVEESHRTEHQTVESFPALKWYSQQDHWIRDPNGSDNACFNYPLSLRMEGPLRPETLRRGLEEIVRRHQVFRSVFSIDGQEITQRVIQEGSFRLPQVNLEFLDEEGRSRRVLELAVEEARRPFDLTREPLLRGMLLRTGPENHVLLLTTHHLACDDWSAGILLRELSELYSAFSRGLPSPLPQIGYQYSDFVRQHISEMPGKEYEDKLEYWKQQFADGGPFYHVATDHPRPVHPRFRGRHEEAPVPASLENAINHFSQVNGVSPFMTFVAGFMCLFARYSDQEDVGLGICVANRTRLETEQLIGPLSNRLLLRVKVPREAPFQDVLETVRDAAWDGYACQDVPWGELVETVVPDPARRHDRLFQTLIVLENAPKQHCQFEGLNVSPFSFDPGTACYDLHIWLKKQDGLRIAIQYDSDLFQPETLKMFVKDYLHVLESLVDRPCGLVKDLLLPALSECSAAG